MTAKGGTQTQNGVTMANEILSRNPLEEGEKRNRVVIVFTDGEPGQYGYDPSVANAAIKQAQTIKDAGATVYTVGIFAGADATTAGNENGNNTAKCNWFYAEYVF